MLAEEMLALAGAGGTALLGAVATDAWGLTKRGFARVLGRGDQDRIAVVEERLERTRTAVEAAGPEAQRVRLEQQAAWVGRLEDLLADHPDSADELRELLRQVCAAAGVRSAGQVMQHAVASGHAQQAVQGHGQQSNVFGAAPSRDDS
ncbi:MAG TPA: hypothetical protein VF755_24190 [Catenuloplanes sp.]|jgi:hypothetical protein